MNDIRTHQQTLTASGRPKPAMFGLRIPLRLKIAAAAVAGAYTLVAFGVGLAVGWWLL